MTASASQLFDLSGRVALVTGGSRGIGRAIAQGLAGAGARVVVAARSAPGCEETAHAIVAAGGAAAAVAFDLADLESHARPIEVALDAFGRLDVLVNNGGILRPHFLEKLSASEIDELHATNVRGPVMLARAAFPHLAQGGRGAIVNVTAVAGHAPMQGLGAYGASKAALINWTRVMAREWTPRGVRVNGLTPGSVATEMILPRDPGKQAKFREEMAAGNLVGRLAAPEEMVGPALFLASDASSFMTGQILVVDGGMLA
ncbi:MAG TPA: SDR family oxidoreductase [Myxococcota bacterium]|nr:SDR family oxidoreductase [Myxococcota bacterium]